MIVILHGLLGKPSPMKQDFFERIDPFVYQPKIDYNDTHNELARIQDEVNDLIMRGVEVNLIVGTSIGGFYAEHLAHIFDSNLLMVNPSLNTDRFEKEYERYKITNRFVNGLALLDKNDELLDHSWTKEIIKDRYEIVEFYGKGHRFSDWLGFQNLIRGIYKKEKI